MTDRLSIRAYARHRGVSDTAVRKAIEAGRITPNADGTINAAQADAQWSKNTDAAQQRGKHKPVSNEAIAGIRETLGESAGAFEPKGGGTTLLQAKTANEVLKAQTNRVRLARLKGELVNRDQAVAHVFKMARAGELSAVRVPDAADEAVRDLVRAREDAVRECRNARHRLKALLLRNGISYAGKSAWTAAHLRWLATLKMAHATQQIGFQEYLHAITEATARIGRLEQALRDALPEWTLRPLVQALHALRGVQLIAAMTLVAELQDFTRFANPRQLMSYVGLVPGEYSSGPKRRQGAITKAGNSAARRMLVEVAWHYQHSARVTPIIAKRQDQLPKEVNDIAWAAQLRLNSKFRRLVARRVMKTKAVVAVARELAGFVWAIGREVQTSGWQGITTEAAKAAAH